MLYKFLVILVKLIIYPLFRIEVIGKENIPKKLPYIICGNHWSNWDPIFLAPAINDPVSFMAKKELFEFKLLSWFLKKLNAFPIDRENMDLKSLRYAVDLIKNKKILGIFPEGTRVTKIDRKNIKDGAGYIALKAEVDVIPVEIISTYKIFKKTKIIFKKPLKIENYIKYKKKLGMEKLMDDTFVEIYQKRKELNSYQD